VGVVDQLSSREAKGGAARRHGQKECAIFTGAGEWVSDGERWWCEGEYAPAVAAGEVLLGENTCLEKVCAKAIFGFRSRGFLSEIVGPTPPLSRLRFTGR
jgi:hypothetical protein